MNIPGVPVPSANVVPIVHGSIDGELVATGTVRLSMWIDSIARRGKCETELAVTELDATCNELLTAVVARELQRTDLKKRLSSLDDQVLGLCASLYRGVITTSSAIEAVGAIAARKSHSVIIVRGEAARIPWEWILPPQAKRTISGLLGGNVVFVRQPEIREDAKWPESSTIRASSPPGVGLIADPRLPSVGGVDIPHLMSLHESGQVAVKLLPELHGDRETEAHATLRSFLRDDHAVIHIAVHGRPADTVGPPGIRVPENLWITTRKFESLVETLPSGPLVLLLVCRGAGASPGFVSSVARTLLNCGARSVVASEFDVPDDRAAEFGQLLYRELLLGKTIAHCLSAVRSKMLKAGDLSGLLFSAYASPDAKLEISSSRSA